MLTYQQVAAVVNNGSSSKIEESANVSSETKTTDKSTSSSAEEDSVATGTEEQSNRREAPVPGDLYGLPVIKSGDSYLPSGPSNNNLPVPVYGVPDAGTNNIVYPVPPPDIPPPVSIPSISYGLPQISSSYGAPIAASGLSLHTSNLYGPPLKFSGPVGNRVKPTYGPPRFQYGPPGKPFQGSKFNVKVPYKSFGNYKKIPSTYGPPSNYLKDNFSSAKFGFNNFKILSHGINSFNHLSHSGSSSSTKYGVPNLSTQYGASSQSTQYSVPNLSTKYGLSSISTQYGSPNLGIESPVISGLTAPGPISTEYGIPDLGNLNIGVQTLTTQYGVPNNNYNEPKPQYGPPQPSPHPRPPHPGAPAPPTPPDIKYDGWQPIPGLVSRFPTPAYGVPPADQHIAADLSYNKFLSPPPVNNHIDTQISSAGHGSLANLELEHSHRTPQPGASDSYAAPLNTVTGSGGIVSSSGDEAQGKQHAHSETNHINIGLQSTGGIQDIQTIKSVEYDLFSGGVGSSHNHGSNGFVSSISDSYGAPPLNSYSLDGPYAAGHSYDKIRSLGLSSGKNSFSSSFGKNSFGSYNSHKLHGYKGLSLSSSGVGLIPPSGVYGVPPSGQYGTPLYSGHGASLNALKIKPPKHPVIHGQPLPPGVFESITKQSTQGHGFGGYKISSLYLPPPIPDLAKPFSNYGPPSPSNLYSLPNSHSPISFQNVNHGSSDLNLNFGGATQADLSSYGAPLNVVDGSYSLPQGYSHSSGSDLVEIDFTHPGLTIDLTKGQSHAHSIGGQTLSDCSLKAQNLPSLNYGVPSASGYSSALSETTSNFNGGQTGSASYSGSSALSSTSPLGPESLVLSGSSLDNGNLGHSLGSLDTTSLGLSTSISHSGSSGITVHSNSAIPGPVYGAPEALPAPSALVGYQLNDVKPHEIYGVPDLDGSHSQKTAVVKVNALEEESHGKTYGKHVAAGFGPSSELIQSQSIDLNNIPLKGALGSYTLQIQSADGGQSGLPHGQVLNDGLLQSILAAIEQPKIGEKSQPIDLKQSLEKQNFVTNDTISSVVGQLADAEIRFSTQLVKDEIDKTQQLADTDIQASSAVRFILPKASANTQRPDVTEEIVEKNGNIEEVTLPLVEDNGIALYFSNTHRTKKRTNEKGAEGEDESHNSHK